ncbi:MAG: glycosyltransferase [Prevotella sp.]|nr:glycosyltransferase [Prevotella sp.]
MPIISIVIPVYNVEKLLRKCLDSILSQTFTDYELIIVDDGSADQSGKICDEYKEKDQRIVSVIHQENQGSSAARNAGLSLAKGKYLSFIDADDWVEPQYLQSMLDCAEREHADLVISSFIRESTDYPALYNRNEPKDLSKRAVVLGYFTNLHAGLWNKLVLRELFVKNGIAFPQYNYYEDMVVSTKITIAASNIVYSDTPLYHYVVHDSSMTQLQNAEKRLSLFTECLNNIMGIQEIPFVKSDKALLRASMNIVNFNKKKIIKNVSDERVIRSVLGQCRESITFSNIRSISDLLLYIASRFTIYKPLKYYLKNPITPKLFNYIKHT